MGKNIYVTRSDLPSLDKYMEHVKSIFDSTQLTNSGACAKKFEQAIQEILGGYVSICANGTMALQLALRAAGLNNKTVITTPFTYVATLSALLWEGSTPVFADIAEDSMCISPQSISRLNLDQADGILAVHAYGNACDIDAIEKIGRDAHLPVIYDAAQGFGCLYKEEPLAAHGDFSTLSFHATKVAHSVEGGGVFCRSRKDHETLSLLRAFGHIGDEHYSLGINAKMSELHAAMGLCTLELLQESIAARGKVIQFYNDRLPISGVRCLEFDKDLKYNNQYYPVFFENESVLLKVVAALKKKNIHPRRYFYPSLTELPYVNLKGTCPVAEDTSRRALCLPVYKGLEESDVETITGIISSVV